MPKDIFLEQRMDELVGNEPEKYTHFTLGYAVVPETNAISCHSSMVPSNSSHL